MPNAKWQGRAISRLVSFAALVSRRARRLGWGLLGSCEALATVAGRSGRGRKRFFKRIDAVQKYTLWALCYFDGLLLFCGSREMAARGAMICGCG